MPLDFSKYPLPRRLRHHTKPNLYLPINELKYIGDEYPPAIENINWHDIFGNGRPPEAIDVGCGKGSLLLNYALEHPEINILGIEVRHVLVSWLNDIIKSEPLFNCYALWYSVVNGLSFIADNSIDSIFYLFPDPWPKRKHIKRRAFSIELLRDFARVLKRDGRLYIATDMPDADEYHRKLLDKSELFYYEYISDDNNWVLPLTNKERFCKENGVAYTRMMCRVRT